MKILVGIIHSNEPQVDECINSVKNQNYHNISDYFIITGYSKQIAHDKLYSTFMNKNKDYDIFIKIDGDMIIERKDFLSFIENKFKTHKNLDWIRIELFDFFLKENMSGLNIYSKNVRWKTNLSNFFTDRTMVRSSVRSDLGIIPKKMWISHCKNPTDYQAFNFGFHRAIKAFQYGSRKKIFSTLQWKAFLRISRLNKIKEEKINHLILASLIYVIYNKISDEAINENSEKKSKAFSYLSNMSNEQLFQYYNKSYAYRLLNFGKLGFLFLYIRETFLTKN